VRVIETSWRWSGINVAELWIKGEEEVEVRRLDLEGLGLNGLVAGAGVATMSDGVKCGCSSEVRMSKVSALRGSVVQRAVVHSSLTSDGVMPMDGSRSIVRGHKADRGWLLLLLLIIVRGRGVIHYHRRHKADRRQVAWMRGRGMGYE
jgi:hypothetical protein